MTTVSVPVMIVSNVSMSIELKRFPLEYYFSKGDDISCYGCGTEYSIFLQISGKLSILKNNNNPDDCQGERCFDN